jgi:phosphoribosylanthranilate isomerase
MFSSHIDVCDYFLFDTRSDKHGGSGKKFNWDIINGYSLDKPFFLSGGIGPSDAMEIMKIKNPKLYGVDLNSLFETSPGKKDARALESFIGEIKMSGNEL